MKELAAEVATSFRRFGPFVKKQFDDAKLALSAYDSDLEASYTRLISFQAWRSELLEREMAPDALAFFLEAQNDAVLSHVLAASGCWRPALQCLRSVIDNVYHALYYSEHLVELELWAKNEHRIDRTDLEKYLTKHPRIDGLPLDVTGLSLLSSQYSTLNHAVHASARSFRMTDGASEPQLCLAEKARLGKWIKNEQDVVRGVNLLLLARFRHHLSGASLLNLRKAISLGLGMTTSWRSKIKADLHVVLPLP